MSPSKLKAESKYKLYGYRWLIWIFFVTQQIGLGMTTTGFSPITVLLAKVYGVSNFVTTLLVICYAIIFVLLNVPANMLIKAKGIAWPIRIASLFFISGVWIGMLVNHNFYFLLIGQCVNACGMPFVQAIGATIAGVWFGDKERAQITNITSLASVIGVIIGFGLSAFFVDDTDIPKPEEAKIKILRFILVQSSIVTALSLPILFIVRKEPSTPPSKSAHAMRGHSKDHGLIDTKSSMISHKDFKTDMKTLMTSWNFWKLNLTYSFIYGIFNTLGAVTGVVNYKFGYSTTANSIFGATFVVSGILGSFVHAFLLDKYNRYKLQYIFIWAHSCIGVGCLAAVIDMQEVLYTAVSLGILGSGLISVIGVGNSFSAEITYPISEAIGWGIILSSGSIVSTFLTFLITYFVEHVDKWLAIIMFGIWCVISLFISLFIKEDLKKTNLWRGSVMEENEDILEKELLIDHQHIPLNIKS